jgi:bile acid:Na+ symporter, BASS family
MTIVIGYAFPGILSYFAPFARPALFCLILSSLVPIAKLPTEEVYSLDPDILRIVFWQLFILPTIILAVAHLIKLDFSIVTLVAVTACAGSLFASPALADLLGLNQRKTLQCMMLSTFAMPLSYYLFMTMILHSSIDLDMTEFMGRCAILLMLPTSLFMFYSAYIDAIPKPMVAQIDRVARFVNIAALMVFGLGIIGPAAAMLRQDPGHFAIYLMIVLALGAGMAFLTTIVMYRRGVNNALTASIVSGFRNVGLGFALIESSASSDTSAYVGISQIPIFLAPLVVQLLIRLRSLEADAGQDEVVPASDTRSQPAKPAPPDLLAA